MNPFSSLAKQALAAGTVIACLAGGPARAQEASPNAMTNLIRLLVEQKLITAEAGAGLVAQAEAEAEVAQAQARLPVPPAAPPAPGTVRVPYIPQLVRDEIREELRKEIVAKAESEGWAAPGEVPEWTKRIRLSGDLRIRNESSFYANTNADDLIDFQAFNANGPTDVVGNDAVDTLPFLNTRADRLNRLSVRARLNVTADVISGVTLGIGLASANNGGPTSTTQLLGGGFEHKELWLDLAYLRLKPNRFGQLTLGRAVNPFIPNEILFDEDVRFDGVSASLTTDTLLSPNVRLSATGGLFPFEYVGNAVPQGSRDKARRANKWIAGGQIALDAEAGSFGWTSAVGYYDFTRVRGRISTATDDLCLTYLGVEECATDWSRPAYLNKGNTLMALRNIAVDGTNPNGPQPQYVGLVQDYNVLEGNAELRINLTAGLRFTVNGAFLKNLAYDSSDICRYSALGLGLPVTNIEETPVRVAGSSAIVYNSNPCAALVDSTPVATGGPLLARYASGDEAWLLRATLGTKELRKRGQWNVLFAYKRIEPDAVLDSLSDSDFHLGGTNTKGYVFGGNFMIANNLRLTSRWLSANEVFGRPLSIDVLQMDLIASF